MIHPIIGFPSTSLHLQQNVAIDTLYSLIFSPYSYFIHCFLFIYLYGFIAYTPQWTNHQTPNSSPSARSGAPRYPQNRSPATRAHPRNQPSLPRKQLRAGRLLSQRLRRGHLRALRATTSRPTRMVSWYLPCPPFKPASEFRQRSRPSRRMSRSLVALRPKSPSRHWNTMKRPLSEKPKAISGTA